jgi:hypothetical protein
MTISDQWLATAELMRSSESILKNTAMEKTHGER